MLRCCAVRQLGYSSYCAKISPLNVLKMWKSCITGCNTGWAGERVTVFMCRLSVGSPDVCLQVMWWQSNGAQPQKNCRCLAGAVTPCSLPLACSRGFAVSVELLGNELFTMVIIDSSVWHIGLILLLMIVKLSKREESCNSFMLRVGICGVPVL